MPEGIDPIRTDGEEHLADTNPMRPVEEHSMPPWRRLAGLFSLIGAALFTAGTLFVLMMPPTPATIVIEEPTAVGEVRTAIATPVPTSAPDPTRAAAPPMPTMSFEAGALLLSQPLREIQVDTGFAIVREPLSPFTFVPDRPRSEIIDYEVVSGDTMFRVAERFGIKPESLAWSNPRSIIGNLRPGMILNIPPIDGAIEMIANDRTIADLARGYGVDPYAIIDWESNGLYGAVPETVLVSGMEIFIPGGIGEQISWNPPVERRGGDSSGTGGTITFAPGEAGSCGPTANPGGFGGWTRPISGYSWVQGFYAGHSGVDLAAPVGTPVYAALGGTVIFQGWNSFGYGYLIVLAHGPFTTVYGHLSDIYVRCGQSVSPGQTIGASGNSGNSSGPHLHFEIRYLDVPQDPTLTMAF